MTSLLAGLGLTTPVIAAPMSGGPTTPAMVIAAHRAGGLGFLATGYKTPEAVAADVLAVREAGVPFGVNVFVPTPVPISPARYREYARFMQGEADRFGITLPTEPIDSDDYFDAKIDLLRAEPVPLVSFTFGIPGHGVIRDLQRAGTTVVQTVTSLQEAKAAAAAGVDALAVQATVAGGHSATLTPDRPPPAATSPLRKAAAAAGDPELVHLWAGTGYRHARRQPTEQILSRLVP